MDLSSIKFGLGIATVFMVGVCFLFAVYWKIGEASIRKAKKNAAGTAGPGGA